LIRFYPAVSRAFNETGKERRFRLVLQCSGRAIRLIAKALACRFTTGNWTEVKARAPRKLPTLSIDSVRLAVPRPINNADPDTYAKPIIKALAATHP